MGDDEATETDGGDGGGKRAMATQMMHARRSKAIQMQIMPVRGSSWLAILHAIRAVLPEQYQTQ